MGARWQVSGVGALGNRFLGVLDILWERVLALS